MTLTIATHPRHLPDSVRRKAILAPHEDAWHRQENHPTSVHRVCNCLDVRIGYLQNSMVCMYIDVATFV